MASSIQNNNYPLCLTTTGYNLERDLENPYLEEISFRGFSDNIESSYNVFIPDALNPFICKDPLPLLARYVGTATQLRTLRFEYRTYEEASVMSQALSLNQSIQDLSIRLIPFLTSSSSDETHEKGIRALIESINEHQKINSIIFYATNHYYKDELNSLILNITLESLRLPSLKTLRIFNLTEEMFIALSKAISRNQCLPETLVIQGRFPDFDDFSISEADSQMFALAWLTNTTVRHLAFEHFTVNRRLCNALAKSLASNLTLRSLAFDRCPSSVTAPKLIVPLFPARIELTIDGVSQRDSRPLLSFSRASHRTCYGSFSLTC